MKINESVIALLDGIQGQWYSEPRYLKDAYLWTAEDRQAILASKKRTKEIDYLRIAAANTPAKEINVVIVPNLAIGLKAQAIPCRRIIVVPRPDTIENLVMYLHECGHLAKDYDKSRVWLEEAEAEFFMLQVIVRSKKIPLLQRLAVENDARDFIIHCLEHCGEANPNQYLDKAIMEFIEGKSRFDDAARTW
jgi:hypothetical protein